MRKTNIIGTLVIMVFFLTTGTGCGKEEAKNTVSDVNATGSAVTGTSATVGSDEKQKHPFANKTNIYVQKENELEPIGFDQFTKDGKQGREIRIKNFNRLLAVTENEIFYSRKEKGKPYSTTLCRMPINKGKDGTDELDVEHTEDLFLEEHGFASDRGIYVDADYLVYATYQESSGIIIYNRKSKKKKIIKTNSIASVIMYQEDDLVLMRNAADELFLLKPSIGKPEYIEKDKDGIQTSLYDIACGEDFFSYHWVEQDGIEEIRCYDRQTGKKRALYSISDLQTACWDVPVGIDEKPELSDINILHVFDHGGRLYIEVQGSWNKGTKRWDRYVIFSADPTKENPELVYEDELTNCLWENSEVSEVTLTETEGVDSYNWNSGVCFMMTEGRALLVLNKSGKEEHTMASYDLDSHKFQWLDKGKGDYYLPYYDCTEAYGGYEWLMEYAFMNFLPDELGD